MKAPAARDDLEAPRGMAVGVGQTANLVDCRGSPQQPTTLATPRRTRRRPRSGSNVSLTDTGRGSITAIVLFAEWDRSFPDDARGQRLSAAQVNVKRAVARLARGALAVGEGGPTERPHALLADAPDSSSHSGRSARHRTGRPSSRPGTGRTRAWFPAGAASSEPWRGGAAFSGGSGARRGKSDRLLKSTVRIRSSPPRALSARVRSAGIALWYDADQPQDLNDATSVIDPGLADRSAHPIRSQGSVMQWINLIALCA